MTDDPLPNVANLSFVEQIYSRYVEDPLSVEADWRRYFETLPNGYPPARAPSLPQPRLFGGGPEAAPGPADSRQTILQERVDRLVHAYRIRGHRAARLDPLGPEPVEPPELDPAFHGFTDNDMQRRFSCAGFCADDVLPLGEIVGLLGETYCRSIGVQYMHIDDDLVRNWLQDRMESTRNHLQLKRSEQLRILTRLTDAAVFEEFIRKKFIGAKSFSLEGAESLIPLLDLAIEHAEGQGIVEIVIGMGHRGRLNVLANILEKPPRDIFREFEDIDPGLHPGSSDVKYHLGHSADRATASGRRVHLSLCFNPSHLEFVNPVALGRMRAKQDRVADRERRRGLVLLIHGDAAFAGEGIIQESLNLAGLPAYATGGTLHVIVNNQIGFTTPPAEGRSGAYATDVARMLPIPIFHVNGDDPEAVAHVARLAMDFRGEFRRDAVIDLYTYRRRGHNETDEPSFTQPVMYRLIEGHPPVRERYLDRLVRLGVTTRDEAEGLAARRRETLGDELAVARGRGYVPPPYVPTGVWQGYYGGPEGRADQVETAVAADRLAGLLERLTALPEDFDAHPKIRRGLEMRREMAAGKRPLDWAAAEALAFASLAAEKIRVRLTGQDTARGTFSQRHAVFHDVEDGRAYVPLNHLAPDQAPVEIANSPLSELGVLGFEYGYSLDCPEALVLWEAQFGDFCNAAQVIIDQFIASAETKWRRLSGLVLLLPHGFEGQGPEHSSARLERFLQLAAEDNLQIVSPTTPAQYFHCLRRQALRRWRKPLVILTPKSLLRHPRAVSALEDLATGTFQAILGDGREGKGPARRLVLCAGKIAYDLARAREEFGRWDVALLRLEQLFPLSDDTLCGALAPYEDDTPVVWAQEEPENMGAWPTLRARFGERLAGRLPFTGVCRPPAASPATGSASTHKREQRQVVERVFGDGGLRPGG